ncbi:MAG: PAS domain-containing protein [Acidobacteriota bacterium]
MKRIKRSPEARLSGSANPVNGSSDQRGSHLIDFYHQIAEGAPDWECWRTPEGKCVYVSPSCERITGYRAQQFMSDPELHLSVIHPEDRSRVAAHFCESGELADAVPLEFRILHRNGQVRWVNHVCHPICDERGSLMWRRVLQRDITSYKAAQLALAGQEKLFRELAENLEEVLWIVSPDWNEVLYVSPAYAELWGRSCEELRVSPRSWLDAVLEEDRPRILSNITRVAQEPLQGLASVEYRVRRPDGSIRWVRARGFGIHDETGRIHRVVGIAEDVTDQKQVENALRRRQQEYQTLAGNLPGLVYRVYLQEGSRMHFYNDLLEPTTGFRAEELTTGEICSIIRLIVPEDRERVIETVEEAVEKEQPFDISYRLERKNREIRHMSERGRPIRDENGRPLYIDGLIFDVTDQMLQEEQLREREAQLRAFFDANAVCMSIVALDDDDLVYVRPNETMAAFYGLTATTLSGKRCRELGVSEETLAGWIEMFAECLRTGEPVSREYNFGLHGQEHWYHGTISPISLSSDSPLFALATVDITERKKTEQALRESEARFREVLENALDASYRRDLTSGRLDFMSPVIEQITGFSPEEIAALDVQQGLDLVHPDDRQAVIGEIQRSASGEAGFVEYRFRTKNGEYRWFGDKMRVVMAGGEPRYRVGVVRDITHRKQVEEALRRAKDELEERVHQRTKELELRANQLARLSSELTIVEQRERRRLAQVLHDHLQQLLVGAKFGLDVLSRRIGQKHMDTIGQVEALLNESINTARSLTAELSPPILHEAGLNAALEWLIRWMKEKHGLTVEFDTDEEVRTSREDIRVLIFESVREALLNVVKHAKVTRAKVSLTRHDPEHLRALISDEGVGFEPGVLSNRDDSTKGGFGLVSMRERLRLMGGSLEIESTAHEGTRLILTVPIESPAAVMGEEEAEETREEEGAQPETGQQAGGGGKSARKGRIRVLLVDDHVVMRQGLSMLIGEESDIEIVGEGSNGNEAIALARDLQPDVILMDFSMPEMNGVEATRIIHSELPKIRIIGLSMYEETDRAAAMQEAGAVAYLSKSGRSDALLQTIREARTD